MTACSFSATRKAKQGTGSSYFANPIHIHLGADSNYANPKFSDNFAAALVFEINIVYKVLAFFWMCLGVCVLGGGREVVGVFLLLACFSGLVWFFLWQWKARIFHVPLTQSNLKNQKMAGLQVKTAKLYHKATAREGRIYYASWGCLEMPI